VFTRASRRLLRGNHETEPCNSDARYGAGSFLQQCEDAFGGCDGADELGRGLFDRINRAFDCMPVAAVLAEQLFCCHGGIPHTDTCVAPFTRCHFVTLLLRYPGGSNAFDTLNQLPRKCGGDRITAANITEALATWSDERWNQACWNGCNPGVAPPSALFSEQAHDKERFLSRQRVLRAAYQVMWADPLSSQDASEKFYSRDGFSKPRVLHFTLAAAHDFFRRHNITRIIRGHQGQRTGVRLQLFANVITIFSDSCDHFMSASNHDGESLPSMTLCGCILVDSDSVRCILCQPMQGLSD
jgi:hypothetical protein